MYKFAGEPPLDPELKFPYGKCGGSSWVGQLSMGT